MITGDLLLSERERDGSKPKWIMRQRIERFHFDHISRVAATTDMHEGAHFEMVPLSYIIIIIRT